MADPSITDALSQAQQHLARGEIEQTKALADDLLRRAPKSTAALTILAVCALRQGRATEALSLSQEALTIDPRLADGHNLLGVAYAQLEDFDRAREAFLAAVSLAPQMADAHYNLANVYQNTGQPRLAVESYQRTLLIDPGKAEAHFNLGNALRESGRLAEAAQAYGRAIEQWPGFFKALSNRGQVLRKLCRYDEASACLRQALALRSESVEVRVSLGQVFLDQRRYEKAEQEFRVALSQAPEFLAARKGLGRALAGLDRQGEAIALLEGVVDAVADDVEAGLQLVDLLREQGRAAEALAHARRIERIEPDNPQVLHQLGLALVVHDELDEAVSVLQKAARLKPDDPEIHNNLGVALHDRKDFEAGLRHFDMALRVCPDHVDAHLNRAMTWLRLEEYEKGWQEYEWRRLARDQALYRDPKPQWDGSDAPGKTILLIAEQGLGDTIQFVRFAAAVHQRVGRVILQCQQRVMAVLNQSPGVDLIVDRNEPTPPYDLQAPLVSLPLILGMTNIDSLPRQEPYVFAEDALVSSWRERLQQFDGFKIGVAWQGNQKFHNDQNRSLPLRHFAELTAVEGVQLVSLQKGSATRQIQEVSETFTVVDFGLELDENSAPFMDTAAVMANVDLVISSDTATAHLAGALGVPVWVPLTHAADHRWLEDRDDSPWYPTMRLFRQPSPGDWASPFALMAAELTALVQGDRSRLEPHPKRTSNPMVRVPAGELLDKMTILQIKSQRIEDAEKLHNVQRELKEINSVVENMLSVTPTLNELIGELTEVNEQLWSIEDEIRMCERECEFGARFIELARSVYKTNDRRAAIKAAINREAGSKLVEEKSYAED